MRFSGCGFQQPSDESHVDERHRHLPEGRLQPDVGPARGRNRNDEQPPVLRCPYVAKHFPFPWFASLTGGGAGNPMGTPLTEPQTSAGGRTNCDPNHITNLDDPTHGLVADLQNNTVPQFQAGSRLQLQRRPRHHVQGQQPVGRLLALHEWGSRWSGQPERFGPQLQPRPGCPPTTPRRRRRENYTGGLYGWVICSWRNDVLPIEQSQAYSERRAHRHHVRRGRAQLHLLGQQLQQRIDQLQRRHGLARHAGRAGDLLPAVVASGPRP